MTFACFVQILCIWARAFEGRHQENGCAYKGFAEYWSVDAGGETVKDLAWSYKTPLPENIKIAGLVALQRADTERRWKVTCTRRNRPEVLLFGASREVSR